jgi:NTP pyrophosphatase (non-canonical NTP hydrolase)
MTIQNLITSFQKISQKLDHYYPMEDKEKRIFARVTKMVEEFGELAEVALAKANLQRESKNLTNIEQKIEDEFADVFGTLMLLGLELNVDIEKAIENRVAFTNKRLQIKSADNG